MPTEYPENTPWGRVDLATKHGEGIWFLSTPSHGGFWLSPERQAELSADLKGTSSVGKYLNGFSREGDAWWEEDCDAIKIARHFGIA